MKKYWFSLFFVLFCAISCQPKQEWSYPSFFWGFAVEGFPINQQLLELQSKSQVIPEMIVFYLQWPEPLNRYESILTSLESIWNIGAVPCLTWEPMTISYQTEKMIPYEEILSGQYDHYLSSMAAEVKLWQKPLIIRFAQEMNIERYHWGTDKDNFGIYSPEIYIKMFQYVVNLFTKQKVNNALWAFCPNVESIPNEAWNSVNKYYPGDHYVDILGMDGYNWNINEDLASSRQLSWTMPWRSFEQIFQPLYQELKKINPHKPIIVFETASVNRVSDQKKSLWIQNAIQVAKKWRIKGIVWFQVKKEEDWRMNQNEDYSYIPLIQPAKPSFQTWLLNDLQLKNTSLKANEH